jgi:hypothetical protein
MKILNVIALSMVGLAFQSCSEEQEVIDEAVMDEIEVAEIPEVDDSALEGLTMNLGEKWKVDETTDNGMATVDSLVTHFDGNDYKALGKDIKNELGNIIDLCTMKGEDHNQFHIVLHALMVESKALKKGKSESTEKSELYVGAYYSHFEL